jgi:hypothetical protein
MSDEVTGRVKYLIERLDLAEEWLPNYMLVT